MSPTLLSEFLACDGLTEAQQKELYEALEKKVFSKDEALVAQGEKDDTAYFVFDGRVEVRVQANDHADVVAELGRGSVVGEIGMICQEPRSASVVALTDTTTGVLSRELFGGWLKDGNPLAAQLLLNAFRVQSRRLQVVNSMYVELLHRRSVDHELRADMNNFREKLFGEWSF